MKSNPTVHVYLQTFCVLTVKNGKNRLHTALYEHSGCVLVITTHILIIMVMQLSGELCVKWPPEYSMTGLKK